MVNYSLDKTPMEFNVLFHGYKNVNFQIKKYDIFLVFAQNIECGYPESMF